MALARHGVMKREEVLAEVRDDGYDLFNGGRDDAEANHIIEERPVPLSLAQQLGDGGVTSLAAGEDFDPLLELRMGQKEFSEAPPRASEIPKVVITIAVNHRSTCPQLRLKAMVSGWKLLSGHHKMIASVLRPSRFVVAGIQGTLFSVTDRLDPAFVHA